MLTLAGVYVGKVAPPSFSRGEYRPMSFVKGKVEEWKLKGKKLKVKG
jgi:hypothetical protein